MTTEKIINYLAIFLAVLVVLPAHEFAHAFVAVKSGDDTPKRSGRLTLNPLKHFDIIGLVMLIVARFGWAKPVPINPYNFKHLKLDYFLVSIAGVVMNYIIAFLVYPLFSLAVIKLGNISYAFNILKLAASLLVNTLYAMYLISLSLFVFNLIPVYPLDGFRVVEVISSKKPNGKVVRFLREKGYIVLLCLILINWLADIIPILSYIDIFGFVMNFLRNLIGIPIELFWNFIFGLF